MCVFMWMYATGTQRSQRRVLGPLGVANSHMLGNSGSLEEQKALFTAEPQIASFFKKKKFLNENFNNQWKPNERKDNDVIEPCTYHEVSTVTNLQPIF